MNDQNQTLQPTAKRRQMARDQGHVAVSSHLTAAVIWLTASLGMLWFGEFICAALKGMMLEYWQSPWTDTPQEVLAAADRLRTAMLRTGMIACPAVCLCFLAAVCGRFAQVGYVWAPRRVLPNTQRLNPTSRLSDLFSINTLFRLLRGGGLIVVALLLLGVALWSQPAALARVFDVSSVDYEPFVIRLLSTWTLKLGVCLFVVAIFDYAYQRHRYETSLRMSPEELRAEIQAVQGNPQITAGRRELQREMRERH